MNLQVLIFTTLWAAFFGLIFMGFGVIMLRLVSKVRVEIVLDDADMLALNANNEVTVTTNTVTTRIRYKATPIPPAATWK